MSTEIHTLDWPVLDDGSIRIKTTPWCHVDICLMLTNVRICEKSLGSQYASKRGWCYTGANRQEALVRAVGAALAWDGNPDTEPQGWIKEVTSRRVRPSGDPGREYRGAWRTGDGP
jgi:hypothetical protein